MNAPTNYTDQIDFSTVLESYISENETIRFNAANYIENLRKKSFIDYLKCLFNVLIFPKKLLLFSQQKHLN